jgi:hypothetical protein
MTLLDCQGERAFPGGPSFAKGGELRARQTSG